MNVRRAGDLNLYGQNRNVRSLDIALLYFAFTSIRALHGT